MFISVKLELTDASRTCLESVKTVYAALLVMDYFTHYNPFVHRRNLASFPVLYLYFHGICYEEVHSIVPPPQTIKTGTHHDTYSRKSHPNFFHIHIVKNKFHYDCFFPSTSGLRNKRSAGSFSAEHTVDMFKSTGNRYISCINTWTSILALS